MMRKQSLCASLALVAVLASAGGAMADSSSDIKQAPAGAYQIDPSHTSVTFKINHLGFSHYTGRFNKIEGDLTLDPAKPDQSKLSISVDVKSVDTANPKLEEELRGDKWLDVIKFPSATFTAKKIERTGPTTGKITGDFTLHGVTHTLVLTTSFIGTGVHPFYKKPVVGFSATGTFHRSDYGVANLVPMVGDDVTLEIETEFDKAE